MADLGISGHVAVVTGGGRGIGAAIVRALAAEGARVVVWDRDDAAADATVAAVVAAGGHAHPVVADVTDRAAVDVAVGSVVTRLGSIQALVNCAGFSSDAPIGEMTDEQWASVLEVNLTAPFYVTRAIVPSMIGQHYGRIVNISSRARLGDRNKVNYCAAKAGLVGLTYALALELGEHGITVNAVAPGFVETDRVRTLTYFEDLKRRAVAKTPVRRLGEERDVADAVLYLLGRGSGFVTGEVLGVSGGRWR
ncbi:SDR family NAD(P)-dependent oxidoreductase [Frankia sp. Cr2]|uniref:SDR family NAD(P)-dependent oxidoreductase n=1 Tax=Frankia sp. Cr2 TaxID=3073932 RepID=UPI002AD27643|nr:SDR family NAD(P)-dependent oxidoreductase [Frankia sp. Cr2]